MMPTPQQLLDIYGEGMDLELKPGSSAFSSVSVGNAEIDGFYLVKADEEGNKTAQKVDAALTTPDGGL